MIQQPANTHSNLVLNGDFEANYEYWEDLNNPNGFSVNGGTWQGNPIKYGQLKNEASAFQTLKVEVEPADGARYHLRFLYDNKHKAALGKVLIGKKGVEDKDKLSIDLPARSSVAGVDLLALDFLELAHYLPLELGLHKGDDLDITLISPKRAPDDTDTAVIQLTRIELHVELAPLQLLGLFYDEQRIDPGQVLHLCLGSTQEQVHHVRFEVHPDSHWVDTEAALWADDNPHEAMITSPELGINQGIELPWLLDCPEMEGEAPYLFDLNIYSKYTAEPYPVAVSLGHHRLKLNVLKGATFWPVLEYGQSVPLQVQVLSHYTDKPVPGVEVTWRLGGEKLHQGTSDGEGKADFDYTPDKDGEQTIEVSVQSPYYKTPTVTASLDVMVLRDDPLKAVQVRLEEGEVAAWGEKTGYPDRGSTYSFTLIIPSDSPLLSSKIAVGWREGGYEPEDLDITSVPDFGEPRDVSSLELTWTLVCGDVLDAPFGLFLSCPMLHRESRDNAMSLARNNLKIGEVREANKSPAMDEGDKVYCMIQVLTLNNEPALNIPVDWVCSSGRFTSYTGVDGWASMFDKPVEAGPYEMEAHIRVREDAPAQIHKFSIEALATSEWKDDIQFTFDGKTIDDIIKQHMICLRGHSHTFGIVPKHPDSPFIDRRVSVNWRKGVDPDLGLVFDPPMGDSVLLTGAGVQWTITSGMEQSGIFELEIESESLERKRELTGRLMSPVFEDELSLVFDQMPPETGRSTWYPCLGATHQVTLLPTVFSPLQGLAVIWSQWDGNGLPDEVVMTPDIRTLVPINAGGVRWEMDCRARAKKISFILGYYVNLSFDFKTPVQTYHLDHNKLRVGAVRPAAIDPVLSQGERAWLEVQYLSWFTGLPAVGIPVQWSDTRSELTRPETDPQGWAGHDYDPQVSGRNDIMARVVNPYDGVAVSEGFEVFALDHDPWQDLRVQSEDSPGPRVWAETVFFPRRNSQFDFVISANDNYLQGQQLALGLTGTGSRALGLKMGPVPFGQWRTLVDDLPFTLIAGDEKDGGFSFRLAASRLLALSPLNAVSLGAGSSAIKLSAIAGNLQATDWGSQVEAEVKVVSALSGKPVVGLAIVWEGPDLLEPVTTRTNFYGVARVRFKPAFSGLGQVTATAGESTLSLSYRVNEPRKILEMTSLDLVGFPGVEVGAQVTVVSAGGKLLGDVEVIWRFEGVDLEPTITNGEGKAWIRFKLPTTTGERALTASVRGGELGWDSKRLIFTFDTPRVSRLASNGGDIVGVGGTVYGYALIVSSITQQPIEGAEVFWLKNGTQQNPSTKTNSNGMVYKNFSANVVGEMEIEAQVRDPLGAPIDSKRLTISVIGPLDSQSIDACLR